MQPTICATLRNRFVREDGFSLPEVLVVLLILGILAAVSLGALAGQDKQAMDADAKSNVRNLFGHVQSCYTETEDYTLCDEPAEIGSPGGFSYGTGPGQIQIVRGGSDTTRTQVTITGYSRAVTGGARHEFTFVKRGGPPPDVRTCRSDASNDAGGCNAGSW